MRRQALHNYTAGIKSKLYANIESAILSAYPSHAVVQETPAINKSEPFTWVVEPLDGVANFLRSLNDFCAVLGIYEDSNLRHSIVYDYLQDDEYYASQDVGAMVNQNRLRVAKNFVHDEAIVATCKQDAMASNYSAHFQKMYALLNASMQEIRTSGSTAIDLARVARGRLDAFVTVGPPTDAVQIAQLLVREAGGFATEVCSSHQHESPRYFIAANPQLSSTIGKLLGAKPVETERLAASSIANQVEDSSRTEAP